MVQQIASLKTESAASTLPFALSASALSVQNETRQSFSNEFLRQTQNINVYTQPRERTKPIVSSVDDNKLRQSQADAANKRSAIDKATQHQQHQRKSTGVLDRPENQNAFADSQHNTNSSVINERKATALAVSRPTQSVTDTKPSNAKASLVSPNNNSSNQANSEGNDAAAPELVTNKDINKQNNDAQVDASLTDNDQALPTTENSSAEQNMSDELYIDPDSKGQLATNQLPDNFDYIDYVTTLAEFTDAKGEIKGLFGQDKTDGLFQNEVFASLNTDWADDPSIALSPDQPLTNVPAHVSGPDELSAHEAGVSTLLIDIVVPITQDKELASVSGETINLTISPEDLATLTDAKQTLQSDGSELSPEKQAEVDRIINDLAMQVSRETHGAATPGLDEVLLAALLLGGSTVANTPSNNALPNNTLPTEDVTGKVASNNALGALGSETVRLQDAALLAKESIFLSDKTPVVLSNQASEGVDSKKVDANSAPMINLAQLTDEEATAALENLNARLQKMAPQGAEQIKGNEFIAALQSGLKEFKQQLAQGREPSVDLKAMIAEAMAQISGDLNALQQPKIDAVVNQFNGILQAANAINMTANTQQINTVANTDSQIAKEINISYIEGTKLANGIQGQVISQASVDKAINIFKQEGQQQLAEKVRWMVNAKNATAEIRLDPPDLGGINIKINLSGDIAQVNFNVQSAAAKEALDFAAPRLREMLREHGIELGQSSVRQDSQGGQQNQQPGQRQAGNTADSSNASTTGQLASNAAHDQQRVSEGMLEQRISNGAIGGIDYYA